MYEEQAQKAHSADDFQKTTGPEVVYRQIELYYVSTDCKQYDLCMEESRTYVNLRIKKDIGSTSYIRGSRGIMKGPIDCFANPSFIAVEHFSG